MVDVEDGDKENRRRNANHCGEDVAYEARVKYVHI
jgi:hypothetical protein